MEVVTHQNTAYNEFEVQNPHFFQKITEVKEFLCNEFIHGGHLLSFGAPAVALSIMLLLRLPIRPEFLLISYLLTICVYNFDHFKDIEIDSTNRSKRAVYLNSHKNILPLLIMGYGVGFFSLLICFGTPSSIVFGTAFLLIALLYTLKFKKLTTTITGFKNFYTSLSVALFIIFIALYYSYPITWLILIMFIFLFLQFIMNTSFCDIKDMESDTKQHLKTLPLYFGKQNFLLILHGINLSSFLLILTGTIIQILPTYVIMFSLFTFLYNFYYIQKAYNPTTNIEVLSSMVVDGQFAFWPLLLFVGLLIIH